MMEGRIVASICGRYSVYHNGQIFLVVPRGILRKDNDRLLVGDFVEFDQSMLTIDKILPRKNELIRPRIANIDQILIVSSLEEPAFSFDLIFKYLTFANFNHVHSEVIITKTDILKEEEKIAQIVDVFSKIGVKVHFISNKTKEGIEEIKDIFSHKVSALAGQSGVGKSSFLNAINPSYKREIGEYSSFRKRETSNQRNYFVAIFKWLHRRHSWVLFFGVKYEQRRNRPLFSRNYKLLYSLCFFQLRSYFRAALQS